MLQHAKPQSKSAATGGAPERDPAAPSRQPRGNAAAAAAISEGTTVQAKGGPLGGDAPQLAAQGARAGGGSLPFLDRIQRSFGHHDVSDVKAVVGGSGGDTAKQMGAEAYASGNAVVFSSSPDLHTVAHEAAHVVQQRAGVKKPGGVGSPGDEHERHADEVADLVVKGASAESVLDRMTGSAKASAEAGDVVQMLPEKKVSGAAMRRLDKARAAIKHVKEVIAFGAGNQYPALKSSNFNSYFRMAAMRDPECWVLSPSVRALASQHPDALTAAKAELAGGGNCGEHAAMGFDYLRVTAPGETLNRCDKEGLDHAFVIMGDIPSESDSALTVCDPWPTEATACVWEDHFAHTSDKTKLNVRRSEKADGGDVKTVIAAGLKLSSKGLAMINQKMDDKQTEEELKKGTSREDGAKPWIWNHGPSARTHYDYVEDTAS